MPRGAWWNAPLLLPAELLAISCKPIGRKVPLLGLPGIPPKGDSFSVTGEIKFLLSLLFLITINSVSWGNQLVSPQTTRQEGSDFPSSAIFQIMYYCQQNLK